MRVSILDQNDWGKIVDVVTVNDVYELAAVATKENWCFGEFDNARRTIATFKRTEIFALDIDEDCTLEAAKEIFKDYQHIIATSKSHQKEKNGKVADRFRVILFLDTPIDSDDDFKATFSHAQSLWPFIDKACSDASRFFFPSPEIVSINVEGQQITPSKHIPRERVARVSAPEGERGELWKSTYKFLAEGAAPGHRHAELVKASGNMLEQGYDSSEVISKVDEMAERVFDNDGWGTPYANKSDIKTINRMAARELKYSFKAPEQENKPNYISASELVEDSLEYLADKEGVKGEPTSLEGLDNLLGGGFRKGELTVLMAQAKTGKNTLLHVLLHSYLKRNIPQGYASRELSPANEVLPNLLSIELGINAWTTNLTEEIKDDFQNAVHDWQLFFAPGYGHFPEHEMLEWFHTMKSIGVDFFLFDHFHYALLKEDYEATSKLIKTLKSLSKELDIHISLIVQPRSLRDEERLSLSTLRGGAAIGQALDNLLILERVKGTHAKNVSKLTLEVARHKLARPGSIYLQYDPETTRMTEVSKELVQPQSPQGSAPKGFTPGVRASTTFKKPKFSFSEN